MTNADPEDQQFGKQAAEDQAEVDRLAREGVTDDELSDRPAHDEPRAGRKAPPDSKHR